jgi:hypothetical protein
MFNGITKHSATIFDGAFEAMLKIYYSTSRAYFLIASYHISSQLWQLAFWASSRANSDINVAIHFENPESNIVIQWPCANGNWPSSSPTHQCWMKVSMNQWAMLILWRLHPSNSFLPKQNYPTTMVYSPNNPKIMVFNESRSHVVGKSKFMFLRKIRYLYKWFFKSTSIDSLALLNSEATTFYGQNICSWTQTSNCSAAQTNSNRSNWWAYAFL